jgi:hypothetical protein
LRRQYRCVLFGVAFKRLEDPAAGRVQGRARAERRIRMRSTPTRVRQFVSRGSHNLLWLAIAPWAHSVAAFLNTMRKITMRVDRRRNLDSRIDLLMSQLPRDSVFAGEPTVGASALSGALDKIYRPLRPSHQEIPIADIEQDGFLFRASERYGPRFRSMSNWSAKPVSQMSG